MITVLIHRPENDDSLIECVIASRSAQNNSPLGVIQRASSSSRALPLIDRAIKACRTAGPRMGPERNLEFAGHVCASHERDLVVGGLGNDV